MLRSSQPFSHRPSLALTLLAGVLFGSVSACARPTTTSRAEPEAAPPQDSPTASDLTSGEIQKRPQEPIASLLQGRTPGVTVVVDRPGVVSVRIQGASSFYANTEPLYVVDGIPFTPGPGGALVGINPHDIESIEVLKFPPATSMYGVRGANGVILITTKRPKR